MLIWCGAILMQVLFACIVQRAACACRGPAHAKLVLQGRYVRLLLAYYQCVRMQKCRMTPERMLRGMYQASVSLSCNKSRTALLRGPLLPAALSAATHRCAAQPVLTYVFECRASLSFLWSTATRFPSELS